MWAANFSAASRLPKSSKIMDMENSSFYWRLIQYEEFPTAFP
jgi:hypothetical protein